MGNCLDRSRGSADEDVVHCAKKSAVLVVEGAEEEPDCKSEITAAPVTTEVKIRITRKQLEDLLRRLDQEGGNGGGGAVISELLCMTSSSNFRHRAHAEQWRPALRSIPE